MGYVSCLVNLFCDIISRRVILQFEQCLVLCDAITASDAQRLHHTGLVRLDGIFHLHGFKNQQYVALGHFVALGNLYLDYGALHRGGHGVSSDCDVRGVGALVELARDRGRAARPNIKLGVCGEHGGDPASIHFFGKLGLDYVSCSPFRVPIARLAAAQAALQTQAGGKASD